MLGVCLFCFFAIACDGEYVVSYPHVLNGCLFAMCCYCLVWFV